MFIIMIKYSLSSPMSNDKIKSRHLMTKQIGLWKLNREIGKKAKFISFDQLITLGTKVILVVRLKSM